jgi:hypothetical protein
MTVRTSRGKPSVCPACGCPADHPYHYAPGPEAGWVCNHDCPQAAPPSTAQRIMTGFVTGARHFGQAYWDRFVDPPPPPRPVPRKRKAKLRVKRDGRVR